MVIAKTFQSSQCKAAFTILAVYGLTLLFRKMTRLSNYFYWIASFVQRTIYSALLSTDLFFLNISQCIGLFQSHQTGIISFLRRKYSLYVSLSVPHGATYSSLRYISMRRSRFWLPEAILCRKQSLSLSVVWCRSRCWKAMRSHVFLCWSLIS